MTTFDDIGKALATEEHKQGLPVGGDADHCDRCWDAEIDRKRAECEHEVEVEITTMQGRTVRRTCTDCGNTTTRGTA